MRLSLLIVLICVNTVFSTCLPCCAQDESDRFPYQAMVIADNSQVRSGPALVHYPTQELKAGAIVEVYRHDPGGWCAIRPPRDSFSMIPESVVKQTGDGIGLILDPGVQAWVGTRLGTVEKPLWQVKLEQDEEVELLGKVSWDTPNGQSITWFQIAPPAGEFRWVQMSDLQLPDRTGDLPESVNPPKKSDVATAEFAQSGSNQLEIAQTSMQSFETPQINAHAIRKAPARINDGWKRAKSPIRIANNTHAAPERHSFPTDIGKSRFQVPAMTNTSQEPGPIQPELDDEFSRHQQTNSRMNGSYPERLVEYQQQPERDLPSATSSRLPSISPMPAGTTRIAKLDMALTSEMIQPTAHWNLTPLYQQAEQIVKTGEQSEAGQARRIMQKIRNCQEIQRKILDPNALSSLQTSQNTSGAIGTGVQKQIQYGTTYDAFGYLNELVQEGGTTRSTFVLQDKSGKITHHVSGAPGLNLHRYAKQRVGIKGQRGFHQRLQMDHVTADRVIVLDRLR